MAMARPAAALGRGKASRGGGGGGVERGGGRADRAGGAGVGAHHHHEEHGVVGRRLVPRRRSAWNASDSRSKHCVPVHTVWRSRVRAAPACLVADARSGAIHEVLPHRRAPTCGAARRAEEKCAESEVSRNRARAMWTRVEFGGSESHGGRVSVGPDQGERRRRTEPPTRRRRCPAAAPRQTERSPRARNASFACLVAQRRVAARAPHAPPASGAICTSRSAHTPSVPPLTTATTATMLGGSSSGLTGVKNKQPASMQITAEQILREAHERQERRRVLGAEAEDSIRRSSRSTGCASARSSRTGCA